MFSEQWHHFLILWIFLHKQYLWKINFRYSILCSGCLLTVSVLWIFSEATDEFWCCYRSGVKSWHVLSIHDTLLGFLWIGRSTRYSTLPLDVCVGRVCVWDVLRWSGIWFRMQSCPKPSNHRINHCLDQDKWIMNKMSKMNKNQWH